MEVKTTSGARVDVHEDELKRVLGEHKQHNSLARTEKEQHFAANNKEYLSHALNSFARVTGTTPETVAELKEALYEHLPFGKDEICMLVSMVEILSGWHMHKVHHISE